MEINKILNNFKYGNDKKKDKGFSFSFSSFSKLFSIDSFSLWLEILFWTIFLLFQIFNSFLKHFFALIFSLNINLLRNEKQQKNITQHLGGQTLSLSPINLHTSCYRTGYSPQLSEECIKHPYKNNNSAQWDPTEINGISASTQRAHALQKL